MAWPRLRTFPSLATVPGWTVALAAVLLALALRLLGIRLGLPFYHHPDECWITDNARSMASTPDWAPKSYQYGAPLSAITAWIFRTVGDLRPSLHWDDPGDPVLMRVIARLVGAVISSTGAAGVYVAARYALPGDEAGRRRGAYAAILHATAAALVSHGRYAVTDADLVAIVAWTLGACALFLRGGRFVWALGTLVFAATAFAFKVTAATTLVIPALAFTLRAVTLPGTRLPGAGRMALLGAIPAAVGLFLYLNPHVVIHWQTALGDIQSRSRQTIDGGFPKFILRTPGWDHVRAVLMSLAVTVFHRWAIPAVVAALLAAAGLAQALRDRSKVCIVGIAHALLAVLSIALTSKAFMLRNYLVTLPVLSVGFGFAMQAIVAWTRSRQRARWWWRAPWLPAAFAVVYVAVPFAQAVRAQELSLDARIRAVDWIAARAASKPVSVAWTPDVIAEAGYSMESAREALRRPGVTFTGDVTTANDAARSGADYVAIVSHADPNADWGNLLPFRHVEGYEIVARFEANPYEYDVDVNTPGEGRLNDVVVLARRPAHRQGA